MHAMTIRNLPDETHRALKQRAKLHGKSTEAEVRAILEEAVKPVQPKKEVGLGTALAELGARFGGIDIDLEAVRRDSGPARAADFE